MGLESGVYFIKSSYSSGAMGRNTMGDGQQVYSLPPLDEVPKWEIEKLDDGYYTMSIEGTETAEQNGRVHALIHDEADPEHWVIRPYERKGPNVYT
ncbi:hypothetical protein TWF694_007808 [Orbilia ellipsospora]|uniref:Uncharacterized protein n=1 Tax=Orbilia ellipsospora TaxID=2528407 RepID=A0AAV9XKB8_9PEZI